MSKKTKPEDKLQLTPEQNDMIARLSQEEKVAFDATKDEDKASFLQTLIEQHELIAMSSDENDESFDSMSGKDEKIDYPIFSVQNENNPDGLKPGTKIVAFFEGTVPMFSKEPKENWEKISWNNETFYESKHYRFRRKDGKKFGLYGMGSLYPLEKMPTFTSLGVGSPLREHVKVDPIVSLTYVGLLTKERLKQQYGFELTTGTHAHYWEVKAKDLNTALVEKFRYNKGAINYLKKPEPTQAEGKKDPRQAALDNWNLLHAMGAQRNSVMIESNQSNKQIGMLQ